MPHFFKVVKDAVFMFFPCRCHYSGSVLAHSLQYILRLADVNDLSIIQHDGVYSRSKEGLCPFLLYPFVIYVLRESFLSH